MEPDALFRALAEPHRLAILRLVRDQPRSVGEVTEQLGGISQQAVSQHLQVLREAGLVTVEQQGQRRLHLVRPEGLDTLETFLAQLWPEGLRRLKQTIEADSGE